MKIFIVEDDEDMRLALEEFLVFEGHEVYSAIDGYSALPKLKENYPFDLVLVDLSLPGMSGEELIQEIQSSPKLSKLRIVIGSAFDNLESKARALKVFGCIRKPYDLESFSEQIESFGQEEQSRVTLYSSTLASESNISAP